MTDVIVTTVESLLVEEAPGQVIVSDSTAADLIVDQQPETVIRSEIVEEIVQVVTAGPQGPAGTNEDDMPYAKRVDFVGETVLYRGEAVPGAAESAAAWRIQRLTFAGDDVSYEWAAGSAAFDKVWADRASLSYL